MVTHSDVDFSICQANFTSVGFALKQRDVTFATQACYRNDHLSTQILPCWISICILESIKVTQLSQGIYTR